ncbi:IS1182 family transposase [Bradyrhizobium sp. ISRA463]|uniref:IS1182 family transposase n=1 Tax=Bradyrhizobium sp. ISRA463 TaxID=2866199 RepID=UPI0024792DE6|nr:IS1182 family transposase [Bradyrhizobium sp. ISRA463]WGS17098.1 IS1182 family transposase [Bradyrhizobium sp. ISRA463]
MANRTFKAGDSREQPSLLPPRIEDYVGQQNPVRAIDSFVGALDLSKPGFRHADRAADEVGQPPYDPADLLKLYLYGYINQIRSSRRLEREACRNLELIWLLKNMKPGYRTIANFRKENWAALKAANRSFVLLLRDLGLIGGTFVAIDGALFHGNASKGSIFTQGKLAKQIAALDKEIEAYGKALEANDAEEAKRCAGPGDGSKGSGDVGEKVKELMARRERAQADLKNLETSDKGQLSKTDPDARLLSKGDQTIAGYNVQSVVDDKHTLIVASEVVNRNDAGHLHEMAKAAKEALDVETLQVAADAGYSTSEDLKACEDDGIVAYVPLHEGNGKLKEGRLSRKDFSYDANADAYRCPAGELLRPTEGRWTNTSGRIEIRYLARKAACAACPLSARCLAPKAPYRSIARWEHEDVLERHRMRMQSAEAATLMRRRSAIVEHPFGTLKCRAGYQHFLVRGFDKVRGEWSLMALCYNFTRVLSILGFDRFVAYLAEKTRIAGANLLAATLRAIRLALRPFRAKISLSLVVSAFRAAPAP